MEAPNIIYHIFGKGYAIDQIDNTMTVEELIDFLEDFDKESMIYLSFGNGYTYVGITEDRFDEEEFYED